MLPRSTSSRKRCGTVIGQIRFLEQAEHVSIRASHGSDLPVGLVSDGAVEGGAELHQLGDGLIHIVDLKRKKRGVAR